MLSEHVDICEEGRQKAGPGVVASRTVGIDLVSLLGVSLNDLVDSFDSHLVFRKNVA